MAIKFKKFKSTAKKVQRGVIVDEPNDYYHSQDTISSSKLKLSALRPQLFYKTYIDKSIERVEKKHFAVGDRAHCLTLEGSNVYNKRFVIIPEDAPKRPTKSQLNAEKPSDKALESIAFWKKWDDDNRNKEPITKEEYKSDLQIRDAVMKNPVARELFSKGRAEVTFRTEELEYGFSVQCKTDWLNEEGCSICEEPYIADLKTVTDLSMIGKNIAKFGYYLQDPFYLSTIAAVLGECPFKRFFFVFIEKAEPMEVAVIELHPRCRIQGQIEVEHHMEMLSQAIKTKHWPGYLELFNLRKFPVCYKAEIVEVTDQGIGIVDLPDRYHSNVALATQHGRN